MLSKEPSFSDGMFLKGLHRFLSNILYSTYFPVPLPGSRPYELLPPFGVWHR
jgi:hypothetical protein